MAELDIEALLAPLDADAPCGVDLEYDDRFRELEEALRGKPEQQYGDTVIPAEGSDWRQVQAIAQELWARSRDLRVAIAWLRARVHLEGLQAAAGGLALVQGLLERHWARVHPLLDAEDGNDPTMRLNALGPLVDPAGLPADLRAAVLGGPRGAIGLPVTGRLFELVAGRAVARDGETVLAPAGLAQALRDLEQRHPGCAAELMRLPQAVEAIEALLNREVGTAGPDFKPLRQLVRLFAQTVAEATGGAAGTAEAAGANGAPAAGDPVSAGPAAAAGGLRSREDAARCLEQVCDWLERHEPAHPAPLLIRRAVRLLGMNFLDIVRELVPDGLGTIERLAGQADP